MRLSDLFSGSQVNGNSPAAVQQSQAAISGAHASQVGRQIASLAPGQTIQGEVVARNGSEVQIRVSDDMVLNARVDRDMQLEVGKPMTFEVRNNGQTLSLSPLFANTATDANVLKALDMASLPVNQTTVTMTGLMMGAGLAVDRNSLQQMFREVNAFPGAEVSNVVDLHKLGLPVNGENLAQIESYKNLTHQLVEGLTSVLDALPDTMQSMMQEGNVEGAAQMFRELLELMQELPGESEAGVDAQPLSEGAVQGQEVEQIQNVEQGQVLAQGQESVREQGEGPDQVQIQSGGQETAIMSQEYAGRDEKALPKTVISETAAEINENAESAAELSGRGAFFRDLMQTVRQNGGDTEQYAALLRQYDTAIQQGDVREQASVLQNITQQALEDRNQPLLHRLMTDREVQQFARDGLTRLWTIEPEEVADNKKVEDLYQRLDRQLKSLTRVLEQGGQTESTAFKAVSNISQNLDFLQQLNQAYTYVQLPLRLQQGEAHGELYVYTNKRNLAAKDGQISALLHLDMEHLGPVDVYVAMQAEKVNTRFYVQDDDMLDFLEQHMDLLTQRLQKRGYDCSFNMQVRNKEEKPESGLNGLMAQEKGRTIAQYAFDMRA